MKPPLLFQWTGILPHGYPSLPEKRHIRQASCAAVFPTKAAFLRATGSTRARLPYVSVMEMTEGRTVGNTGAALAVADPGVVYMRDDVNHTRGDDVWVVHPDPVNS